MLRTIALAILFTATAAAVVRADPIASAEVQVVDGDTIKVRGTSYRMVGYDTPEMASRGRRVVGPDERAVANLATERFQELINSGTVDLNEVPCACPGGTHGTKACNQGRKCAILLLNGKNIGDTLIAEELAVPFVCGPTRCPKMPDWRRIIERQHNQ
jgi:endonuclease YncB( thermonuclease family)